MKKFLSLTCLVTALSMFTPAFAAPAPGAPMHNPHVVHAGPGMHHSPHHHAGWNSPPPPPPHVVRHHHRGSAIIGGVLARRSCWNDPFYNYQLVCDYYPSRYYYPASSYINISFPIRF